MLTRGEWNRDDLETAIGSLQIVAEESFFPGLPLMPRQRTHHGRITFALPDDFPHRLERFREATGLSWVELARRPGTHPLTIRWWRAGGRPNSEDLTE